MTDKTDSDNVVALDILDERKVEDLVVAIHAVIDGKEPEYVLAALGSMGWWEPVHRRELLRTLREARRDPNPDVRRAARAAQARLGHDAVLVEIDRLAVVAIRLVHVAQVFLGPTEAHQARRTLTSRCDRVVPERDGIAPDGQLLAGEHRQNGCHNRRRGHHRSRTLSRQIGRAPAKSD